MKTLIEIGEFLANPFVAGILFTVMILPAIWGGIKVVRWFRAHYSDLFKPKNHMYK